MTAKDAKLGAAARPAPVKAPDAETAVDAAAIRELAELLSETELTEIEIERNGVRIRVCRQMVQAQGAVYAPATSPASNEAPAAPKREVHAPGTVTSPMVGTVYVASTPGATPFVKVGDAVNEGDTLLIVEAMKTMNPILAPKSGTVKEICIQDAEPVEFGQPLIVLG